MVKDDLIVKVDELTAEQEILREEVASLSAAREKLRERVTQLEEELRNLKVRCFMNSVLLSKHRFPLRFYEINCGKSMSVWRRRGPSGL